MRVESYLAKGDALIDLIVKTKSKPPVFRGKHALQIWPDREEQKKKQRGHGLSDLTMKTHKVVFPFH